MCIRDSHNGRSALDAVELMNVGANYLREHVTSDVRIHDVIKEGGTAPNILSLIHIAGRLAHRHFLCPAVFLR